MKKQFSIRFEVDGHCVTLVSDSVAVSLKVARVLQESLGCGSAEVERREARSAGLEQLFWASSRPLLLGPDLRLAVSGVPAEALERGARAEAKTEARGDVRVVHWPGYARIYSRADFNYRLKSYLVQAFTTHPDSLEAVGNRLGARDPADASSDGVRRPLLRVLSDVQALPTDALLDLLGSLPECAGLRKPLLDYLLGTSVPSRAFSTGNGSEAARRLKGVVDGAGFESRALQRQLLQQRNERLVQAVRASRGFQSDPAGVSALLHRGPRPLPVWPCVCGLCITPDPDDAGATLSDQVRRLNARLEAKRTSVVSTDPVPAGWEAPVPPHCFHAQFSDAESMELLLLTVASRPRYQKVAETLTRQLNHDCLQKA